MFCLILLFVVVVVVVVVVSNGSLRAMIRMIRRPVAPKRGFPSKTFAISVGPCFVLAQHFGGFEFNSFVRISLLCG